jgi:hypothetical protein
MTAPIDPTSIVLRILLLAAPIGALDVAWFHIYKLRLYARSESVGEEITHLVRGALFPVALGLLAAGQPSGAFFWLVVALIGVDFTNSLLDVLLEPASRAPGGVPRAELAVHVVGGSLTTVAFTLFVAFGWAARLGPTALLPHDAGWLTPIELTVVWGSILGGSALFLFEAGLFACAALERAPATCPIRRFCTAACPIL